MHRSKRTSFRASIDAATCPQNGKRSGLLPCVCSCLCAIACRDSPRFRVRAAMRSILRNSDCLVNAGSS
ncbi:hypothetical protein V5799_013618 [Amblyomma americanum]|uniref:Uncharacterized protein n=1 Tax=Amblyomma americanum TaxID=6943 RepID=A0AAQ4E5F5_AMBAM